MAGHISRVTASMKRYSVKNPDIMINMDQTGITFAKIIGFLLRKRISNREDNKNNPLLLITISTKGKLDLLTVIPPVSASSHSYTLCAVYPEVKANYLVVDGKRETLHDSLIPCSLHYNQISAARSDIIL